MPPPAPVTNAIFPFSLVNLVSSRAAHRALVAAGFMIEADPAGRIGVPSIGPIVLFRV